MLTSLSGCETPLTRKLRLSVPAVVVLALSAMNAQAAITIVANAASFVQDTSLTPGAIITILGSNLSRTTATFSTPLNPPKSLGGVTVTVGGIASNLFYVSPTQVNAQLDPSVQPGVQTLVLTSATGTFTTKVTVEKTGMPGLFSLSGSGTRDGAVLNAITFAPGPFSVTTSAGPTYLAIYATGLDLSSAPKVTIGGVSVPVLFYGFTGGATGLQQINVQLIDKLAGAGRVEVAITAGGKTSNPVEIVIVPNPGQGTSAQQSDTQQRSRELAGLAYVPGTSLALVADENDDVIRVVDVIKRAVIRTITLPEGAEPVAIAVNAAGTLAVVAERERGKIAIIDLSTYKVMSEVTVGLGPSSVDIAGTMALVVNQDSDNVTIVNLVTKTVVATVPVGRGPRSVSIDQAKNLAYVTNEVDGSIYVIDIAQAKVVSSIVLEANSRPQSILVAQGKGIAIVTEPSAATPGKVVVLGLNPVSILGTFQVNPDDSGGSSDLAIFGNKVFFANQAGGAIAIASVPLGGVPTLLKVDAGPRALAVDTKDNLLLVGSEGTGTIVLVDLNTQQIVGRINAILGETEAEDDDDQGNHHDDHDDRDKAGNTPSISDVTPDKAKQGDKITITVTGKNLNGATDVIFVDPDSLPGKGKGRGNGNSGNHNHGPFGKREAGIVATNIKVNAAGTQLIADITIAGSVAKGDFVIRIATPNGESTFVSASSNSFKVN
jgi:uncharacterized protein (TIGR03437 family)